MSVRSPTATEALLEAGYTHRRAGAGAFGEHDVVRVADGIVVARLKAHEVWAWLQADKTKKGRQAPPWEGEPAGPMRAD